MSGAILYLGGLWAILAFGQWVKGVAEAMGERR